MWEVGNREQRMENGESSMGNRDSDLGAEGRIVKLITRWVCIL